MRLIICESHFFCRIFAPTWHCGRHSFGTQLLNEGANIKVVSSLLGHSSLRFTEIYVRVVDEEKKKAINTQWLFCIDIAHDATKKKTRPGSLFYGKRGGFCRCKYTNKFRIYKLSNQKFTK